MSGSNSVVECQLPKLDVAGSSPVSRSLKFPHIAALLSGPPSSLAALESSRPAVQPASTESNRSKRCRIGGAYAEE